MGAAKAYEVIVKDEPDNAYAWSQLGMSYYWLKQYDDAIEPLKKSTLLSQNAPTMYNLACAYALSQRPDDALHWLEKAVAANLSPFAYPEKDPDLKILYELPRFKRLFVELDKKRRPCQYSDEAHQFDFWLGEWDVFNPQGQQAGTSVIESVSEGCGILEQWKNRGGTTGTSLNFYDAGTGKWHQYWMGPTGVATRYEGVYENGAIRYHGERVSNDGKKILLRLTFFDVDKNTVRQFAEQSADGGKTWTVSYDFRYVRKKQ
jgi:tetratricopeptide (TPR) repeat protein